MRARGVDASSVQHAIDWDALRAGGFDYVLLKGTEGAHGRDLDEPRHLAGARRAGVLVAGVYHVLTTQTPIADQATNALALWKDHGAPIACDFEIPAPELWVPPITGEWLTKRALEFVQRIKDAGARATLYTYPYFARALPKTPELEQLANACDLWWAEYHDERHEPNDGTLPRLIPGPWSWWTFWQWSGDHGLPAPGIPQVVDHDLFNGDLENLREWLSPPSVDQAQETKPAQGDDESTKAT